MEPFNLSAHIDLCRSVGSLSLDFWFAIGWIIKMEFSIKNKMCHINLFDLLTTCVEFTLRDVCTCQILANNIRVVWNVCNLIGWYFTFAIKVISVLEITKIILIRLLHYASYHLCLTTSVVRWANSRLRWKTLRVRLSLCKYFFLVCGVMVLGTRHDTGNSSVCVYVCDCWVISMI